MRIKVVGECETANALRGLLRRAGFAVVEFLPHEVVRDLPSGGYVIHLVPCDSLAIGFDSVDSELEASILRHVTQLSARPVVVDRPGGQIHSDREIRILVPEGDPQQTAAVEYGVLRGLMDMVKLKIPALPGQRVPSDLQPPKKSWWQSLFQGGKQ
jgi:hypothetical protein